MSWRTDVNPLPVHLPAGGGGRRKSSKRGRKSTPRRVSLHLTLSVILLYLGSIEPGTLSTPGKFHTLRPPSDLSRVRGSSKERGSLREPASNLLWLFFPSIPSESISSLPWPVPPGDGSTTGSRS